LGFGEWLPDISDSESRPYLPVFRGGLLILFHSLKSIITVNNVYHGSVGVLINRSLILTFSKSASASCYTCVVARPAGWGFWWVYGLAF